MRTSIIGAGGVARALAGRLGKAGHEVVVGARRLDAVTGIDAEVTDLRTAAAAAPLVVNALPGSMAVDVLVPLRAELAGLVLVDVANAVDIGPDGFATRLRCPGTSLAAELQRALPDARVVKALNTLGPPQLMVEPFDTASTFLCGDDEDAKAGVREWLGVLGWRPDQVIDLGGVDLAWWPESFVLMVRPLVERLGYVPFALALATASRVS